MAELITKAVAVHGYKIPPRVPGHFLLGSAPEMQQDAPRFLLDLQSRYGDIVRMRFAFWPTYVVYHPDGVRQILQTNHKNYNNKDFFLYKMLRPLFGMGLLTNDGQSWLHQRRLIQPAFHRKRVAAFGARMVEPTLVMLDRWRDIAERQQPLDVAVEMYNLMLCIAGKTLFNINLNDGASDFERAFLRVNKLYEEYFYAPFPPIGVPTQRNRRLLAAIRKLNQVVDGIIDERRRQHADGEDLLSMLLLARDEETGQGMSERQLHDEVMNLLLAGHETTATALTWTLYLLSQHPDVEQHFHAELDEVLGVGTPTVEHLARLSYTEMVLEEAMRLYPPAWLIGRKAAAADEIGGYRLPANSMIFLSPYCTHRHPAFWENPEMFDPGRFAPERSANRAPYAYFPFAGGPRQCIGNMFALMEMKLVLATIGQRYRLRLKPGHRVEYEAMLNIRPRYGMLMTLQAR